MQALQSLHIPKRVLSFGAYYGACSYDVGVSKISVEVLKNPRFRILTVGGYYYPEVIC